MVEIDVKRAIAAKTYSGQLSFDYEANDDLLSVPYVTFSSPVAVSLTYDIKDDGRVFITGTVRFRLKGLCSRCLSEAENEYVGDVDALFVLGAPQEEEYSYQGGKIKLEEAVRDAVMFALPSQFLCGNACEIPDFH